MLNAAWQAFGISAVRRFQDWAGVAEMTRAGVMDDGKPSGADVLRVMMTTPIQTSCEDV